MPQCWWRGSDAAAHKIALGFSLAPVTDRAALGFELRRASNRDSRPQFDRTHHDVNAAGFHYGPAAEAGHRRAISGRLFRAGYIDVRYDAVLVAHLTGITFRTAASTHIDSLMFSTFFGGHDSSWAPSTTQHIDFATFRFAL